MPWFRRTIEDQDMTQQGYQPLQPISFRDPGQLVDRDLTLRLIDTYEGSPKRDFAPSYNFYMINTHTGKNMGRCSLRIGHTENLCRYIGHVGYGVNPSYRGNRYAARSCKLMFPLAYTHGVNPLWITCNPDNMPSRRTLEIAGGELIDTVDVPRPNALYQRGEKQKCRYRFDLNKLLEI